MDSGTAEVGVLGTEIDAIISPIYFCGRRDILLHKLHEWHRLTTLLVGLGHHDGLSVRNVTSEAMEDE